MPKILIAAPLSFAILCFSTALELSGTKYALDAGAILGIVVIVICWKMDARKKNITR